MDFDRAVSAPAEPLEVQDLQESRDAGALPDARLLERFVLIRDGAAFAELVRRHQNLVMAACLRILQNTQAAEDAFQETFLALARRARSIRIPDSLAGWLHRVASNAALQLRLRNQRRSARESLVSLRDLEPPRDAELAQLTLLVDETLEEIPEKYRLPLILCYLEGRTNESAAERLGHPKGSMSTLIARGLDLMRDGLRRKGVAVSGALVVAALAPPAQAVAPPIVAALAQLGGWTLAGSLKIGGAALLLAIGAVSLAPPPSTPPPVALPAPALAAPPAPIPTPDPAEERPRLPAVVAPVVEPEALPPLPDLPATASEKARAALQRVLERRETRGPASLKVPKAPSTPPGLERAAEAGRASERARQAVENTRGRSGK